MENVTVTDQIGNEVKFSFPPKRIVSVVPSQTELLFDLDLDAEIVGVTWFCIHPEEEVTERIKVGGTKNLKIEKILQLKPDLVIANKEENDREQIELLSQHVPVWVSNISNLKDALEMMLQVGKICNREIKSIELVQRIREKFSMLPQLPPLRTLYLIWREPFMTVGSDTFIHYLMDRIGLINIASGQNRYPEIHQSQLKELSPELVLLSSEPYPFNEKHLEEIRNIWPQAKIMLVDGEMFSWYGSRLLKAPEYFQKLLKDFKTVAPQP